MSVAVTGSGSALAFELLSLQHGGELDHLILGPLIMGRIIRKELQAQADIVIFHGLYVHDPGVDFDRLINGRQFELALEIRVKL